MRQAATEGSERQSSGVRAIENSSTSAKRLKHQPPLQVVSLNPAKERTEPERENYCLLQFFMFAYQLKAQELSRESGVPKKAITALEEAWPIKQKVDMNHVYILCNYFNCKVEQFFIPLTSKEATRMHLNFLSTLLVTLPSRVELSEFSEFRHKA